MNSYNFLDTVNRARDYRLYTKTGKRILDFYLADGAAILGHRPPNYSRKIKAVMDKGLYAAVPSIEQRHLEKILSHLFPDYAAVRIYVNKELFLQAIQQYWSLTTQNFSIDDPFSDASNWENKAIQWRPFLPFKIQTAVLCPILPGSFSNSVYPVCFRKNSPAIPDSSILSPVLCAGLHAAWTALYHFEINLYEKLWPLFDSSFFSRTGPYLIPNISINAYQQLCSLLLHEGFLFNQEFPKPSIIPQIFSEGELKKLKAIFDSFEYT